MGGRQQPRDVPRRRRDARRLPRADAPLRPHPHGRVGLLRAHRRPVHDLPHRRAPDLRRLPDHVVRRQLLLVLPDPDGLPLVLRPLAGDQLQRPVRPRDPHPRLHALHLQPERHQRVSGHPPDLRPLLPVRDRREPRVPRRPPGCTSPRGRDPAPGLRRLLHPGVFRGGGHGRRRRRDVTDADVTDADVIDADVTLDRGLVPPARRPRASAAPGHSRRRARRHRRPQGAHVRGVRGARDRRGARRHPRGPRARRALRPALHARLRRPPLAARARRALRRDPRRVRREPHERPGRASA